MGNDFQFNNELLNYLLAHPGYGSGTENPRSPEILFVGNESGTNGFDAQYFIESLTSSREAKFVKNISDHRIKSPMIQFMNRIYRYSVDKNPIWLSRKSEMKELFNNISYGSCLDYAGNIHLIDIRPLPRRNEREGFIYLNNSNFSAEKYLKAFNNFDDNLNSPYGDWVKARKSNLTKQLSSYVNLKYIIAGGSPLMKIAFLNSIFPDLVLEKKVGAKSGKAFYLGTIKHHENELKICVCNFLSHYNGIGFNGLADLVDFVF